MHITITKSQLKLSGASIFQSHRLRSAAGACQLTLVRPAGAGPCTASPSERVAAVSTRGLVLQGAEAHKLPPVRFDLTAQGINREVTRG